MSRERHPFVLSSIQGCAIAGLAFAMLASAAPALEVVEVRVALHPGFTRVVFETDAPLRYRLPEHRVATAEGFSLWLDAVSSSHTASVEGDRRPTVWIEPAATGGSDVWIRAAGSVTIQSELLSTPDRLVVDLWDAVRGEVAPEVAETSRTRESNALESPPQSLEPVSHAVPVEPALSALPAEPAMPAEPAAPLEAVELAEAAAPIEPTQPAAPVEPAQPAAPVELAQPAGTGGVVQLESVAPRAEPGSPAAGWPSFVWLSLGFGLALLLAWLWYGPVADRKLERSPRAAVVLAEPAVVPSPEPEPQPEPEPETAAAQPQRGGDAGRESNSQTDPGFHSDMLQMLRQIDARVAELEGKLSSVATRQDDASSRREADRVELEVHRAALARFQRLVQAGRSRGDRA